MKNDNGSVEGTLLTLLFSLTFSSVVIAFLLLQFYGYAAVGNEGIISLPSSGVLDGFQNYKTNEITDSVNLVDGLGKYVFVSGIGRVLSNNPDGLACNLLLRNVMPENRIYTVNYELNNSVHQDFTVYARYYNGVVNIYNIPIKFSNDGIHVIDGLTEFTDVYFYPYSGLMQMDKLRIKTVFNEDDGELKVYLNNALLFTRGGFWNPVVSMGNAFYAGVMSKTEGFTVETIDAGSFNFNTGNDVLSQIGAFIDTLIKIVFWNVNSQFLPLELNLLFIKTQLAGVIICIIIIIRG